MTLYINVTEADRLPRGGYLIVEGSKAGLLASKQIGSSQRFSPPFLIKCASDDVITFKLAPSLKGYESNQLEALGTLHGPVLTKRYKNELIGASYVPTSSQMTNTQVNNSNLANNVEAQKSSQIRSSQIRNSSINNVLGYDIQMYNERQENAGVLHCTITYDRVSHFEGQFCTGPQKQPVKIGQKVALFKGRCPTKNLFSMIDPAADGQQFKFIESIYKDGDEQYIL